MSIWFTADHHFGHENIIKFCNRPFDNVQAMNETMIAQWNEVVDKSDTVYHLGDFSLSGDLNEVAGWLWRLNGEIHILAYPWHHDGRWLRRAGKGFFPPVEKVVLEPPIVVLDDLVLCHFPFEVWDRKHYGSVHLHGHSHGRLPKMENRVDVGVDC